MKFLLSFLLTLTFIIFVISGCGKQPDKQLPQIQNKTEFSWKNDISIDDIPVFNIKGFLRGKEVKFSYINYEKWHGPNDNVINFSIVNPSQPCGFIENFQGVQITRKGRFFEIGNYEKKHFNDNYPGFDANYKMGSDNNSITQSTCDWNMAVKIDSIDGKKVYAKIALCFNDENKSWIAGKFEAFICNN